MADRGLFERWLMHLATANAPSGREEWVRAMHAEFEMAERGRIGWAFGCLSASLGWRLRTNWKFLTAIILISVCLQDSGARLGYWLFSGLPSEATRTMGYAFNWGSLALVCLLLAAIRPRLWMVIGLGVPLIHVVTGLGWFAFRFHMPISRLSAVHLMDAQLDVGLGAQLGYSLIGALVGRSLGDLLRQAAPSPPRQA